MAEGAKRKDQWLTPTAALTLLSGRFPQLSDAKFAIVQYAATGAVRARCLQGSVASELFESKTPSTIEPGTVLRKEFWAAFGDQVVPLAENWDVAVFSTRGVRLGTNPLHSHTIRLVGVEFLQADLLKAFGLSAPVRLLTDQTKAPLELSRAPTPIVPLRSYAAANPRPVGTLEQIAPELAPYLARERGGDEMNLTQIGTEAAIAELQHQAPPTRANPRKRDNPMTEREIKAWHRGLSKAEKTLSVTALWERALEDNPGRHLPRKMIEPFGENRGTGHRAAKASSPNSSPKNAPRIRGTS